MRLDRSLLEESGLDCTAVREGLSDMLCRVCLVRFSALPLNAIIDSPRSLSPKDPSGGMVVVSL